MTESRQSYKYKNNCEKFSFMYFVIFLLQLEIYEEEQFLIQLEILTRFLKSSSTSRRLILLNKLSNKDMPSKPERTRSEFF